MRRNLLACATLLPAIALTATASAGTISIGQSLLEEESDIVNHVNTGGTLVSAANFGRPLRVTDVPQTPRNSDVTVNGLLHLLPTLTEGATHPVNADRMPELTINSVFNGDYRGANIYGLAGETMKDLMGGIAGNNPAGLTFEISGLTQGEHYLFQVYWESEGSVGEMTFEGTEVLSNISGGTDDNLNASDYGTLISYEFTADDSVLNVAFNGGSTSWLQGYSLQTVVPEPSSLALLGLGGLVIARRRRG